MALNLSVSTPTVLADFQCVCGEGPLYDTRRNTLFWTDIDAGRLFRHDFATGQSRQIYTGANVGGFTLQENGELLLFRVSDIVRFDPDSSKETALRAFSDEGSTRFNDTQASPRGGCFAGTIGKTETSGGLFKLDSGAVHAPRLLHRGTNCANGIAWSPDHKTMYWQCSSRGKIFAYDYDGTSDSISNERLFYHATKEGEGTPDGMAVDSQGNVYSARWGGHGVYVYAPDATFITKIPIPAKQTSSLCFGGPDAKDLFITTAGRDDATPGAGALYHCKSNIPGLLQFRSRIGI